MALAEKIEVLRRIDSIIDFNRATAQLRILIVLNNSELSIDELVKKTGLKRKTILDAVRKLEIKGLVERDKDKYRLTELGRNIYNSLRSIAIGKPAPLPSKPIIRTIYYDTYDQLLNVIYMLKAVKVLGKRKNKPMTLKDLAKKVGVSQVTLGDHIAKFMYGELKIFEKLYDIDNRKVYYRLTELGLKLYNALYPSKRKKYKRLVTVLSLLVGLTASLTLALLVK